MVREQIGARRPTDGGRGGSQQVNGPGVIAVTGIRTFLGQRLMARLLEARPEVRVVGVDRRRPFRLDQRVRFHRVDLCEPEAGARLAEVLREERVEALVHCAFRREPTADIEMDHELETLGSLHVTNACAAAKVARLVVASTTMTYGPRADNPNFLRESHPLHGHPHAHCVQNRVEVEELVARFAERHPDTTTAVLRPCWIMGPDYYDHVVRHFALPVVPTVLGYDPLLQFVHEEDAVDAFERAVLDGASGVFNVVGKGVLPLSTYLALAGRRSLALPSPLLRRVAAAPSRAQAGDEASGFFDFLRYLWVADGRKGWEHFGEPMYSSREAWISFVASRRLQRYR